MTVEWNYVVLAAILFFVVVVFRQVAPRGMIIQTAGVRVLFAFAVIALLAGFMRPTSTFTYVWDVLLIVAAIVTFVVFLRGIRQFSANKNDTSPPHEIDQNQNDV